MSDNPERKQINFSSDSKARWMEEEIEVELRNHKDSAVDVQVRETLFRWSNWTILSSTQPYVKEDANTITSTVKVAANGSAKLRYRVRYTW